MATDKLTLSVDKGTINLAKELALENNTSVSKLFKELINSLPRKSRKEDPLLEKIRTAEIPDWITQLIVTDKPTPDFDHKAEYHKHLEEKFGS